MECSFRSKEFIIMQSRKTGRRTSRKVTYSKRSPAYKKFTQKVAEYNKLVYKYRAVNRKLRKTALTNTPAGKTARTKIIEAYNLLAKKGQEVDAARSAVLKQAR